MSPTNDSVISFAEGRTFRAFIALYALMSIAILALMGSIYYDAKKEQMLSSHRLAMQLESERYIPMLRGWLSQDVGNSVPFPIDLAYNTAFYDALGMEVASYLQKKFFNPKQVIELREGYIHFYIALASYGIGDFYLTFETEDDGLWQQDAWKTMLLYGTLMLVLLGVVGYYLGRLIFAPMREAITLLDDFIKDTTHELNTPLQVILGNVEMIDAASLPGSLPKKFERITIAAETIAALYDDLTYLMLNHAPAQVREAVNVEALLRERLDYFRYRCDQKQLHVSFDSAASVRVTTDRNKLRRLVDNLLSNAIKYNHVGGSIRVMLDAACLKVIDSGEGIDPKKMHQVFKRYVRASSNAGGFGIGLHIVSKIVGEEGWRLTLESTPGSGSTLSVFW